MRFASTFLEVRRYVTEASRDLRDVGEVQGGRRGEDVLEVLRAGFLEAVERRVGEVLGQALVVQAVPRQRHRLVFGQRHADDLSVHLLAVQVAHGFGRTKEKSGPWRRREKTAEHCQTLSGFLYTGHKKCSSGTCRKDNPLTQLSLVGVRHLNEGAVLFIVKDFHPLDITVHSCMRAAGGQVGRQTGRQAGERARWETKQTVRKTKTQS